MTKDDFLKINRIIGELPPDNSIRIEYLEKQFSDLGLSKESGYKAVQYFYNELRKAKDGLNSIFKGKIIINENDKTFSIVDHFTCYFKMTIEGFEKRNEIFFPINLPSQPINSEIDTEKYTAKHYLLAYLFECNAKGVSYPIGNKKELERIGNERMGAGKGNRFYKVFNEVINKDLNAEKNLFEIGGEYWRKAVIELSKAPELVENYLQSKQL